MTFSSGLILALRGPEITFVSVRKCLLQILVKKCLILDRRRKISQPVLVALGWQAPLSHNIQMMKKTMRTKRKKLLALLVHLTSKHGVFVWVLLMPS